jgi:hypothetical protein
MRSAKPKDFRSIPTATGARPTPAVYPLLDGCRSCVSAAICSKAHSGATISKG